MFFNGWHRYLYRAVQARGIHKIRAICRALWQATIFREVTVIILNNVGHVGYLILCGDDNPKEILEFLSVNFTHSICIYWKFIAISQI